MADNIDAKDFKDKVIEQSKKVPVLVDFWAAWCGPCRMQAPILEEIDAELSGQASVVKIDVDAYPDIAGKYGIRSIPTLLLFKDGQVVGTQVGLQTKDSLVNSIKEHM